MVMNSTRGKRERIGRILRMHANKREELTECDAGNIYAAVGLRDTRTGDTLCDENKPIILEKMVFPEPVISIAIEPKTKADVEKLGVGSAEARLRRSVVPHLHQRRDGADHHRRHGRAPPRDHRRPPPARVQGRVERRQARGRLPREHRARRSTPSTSTPSSPAVAASTATCSWSSSRASAARASSSRTTSSAASSRRSSSRAIEKGVREAMDRGVLAGYPIVDMQGRLYDGSYHDVDSSAQAFEIAASLAFQDGAKRAGLHLLEPIMNVEVVVPEQYMGDVIGDLNSRRGRILGMSQRGNAQVIDAEVPLATMFGYVTDLRIRDAGSRDLHDALLALRTGPAADPGRDRREGQRPKLDSRTPRL